jgi:hypothetical protein
MRHRAPVRRLALLVAALLQLVLPPAAAWAEAELAAQQAGRTPVAHVEEHTQPGCVPVHAAECALCHVLTASAVPARAVAPPPVAAAALAPADPVHPAPPRVRHPHTASRAPPPGS